MNRKLNKLIKKPYYFIFKLSKKYKIKLNQIFLYIFFVFHSQSKIKIYQIFR